jgi:hypothetical protein
MQQIDPNFDEKNAGFSRFSKFIIEAGQRGVVKVNKMENGQYEVAPAGAAPAPPEPAREPGRAAPEGERRGRGRGRGGGRGRERPAAETPRAPAEREQRGGEVRRDGALTLAAAFQLIARALGELKPPVSHEALRLRMVALHGREDPLLEPGRFVRLLRQANDAEVADVRKIGDDEYEVAPHRLDTSGGPQSPAALVVVSDAALSEPAAEAPVEAGASGGGNGQRPGIRFRRGSRGGVRAGQVPLIGVVPESPAPEAVPADAAEDGAKPARARGRGRGRGRASKGGSGAATIEAGEAAAAATDAPADAAPKRRPRPRAKKKPE